MTAAELSVLRDRVARATLEREKPRPVVVVREPRPIQIAAAVRYQTAEERIQARKRTWRESKRRPCPECGGVMSHPASKTCWNCYIASREPQHGTISRYVSKRHKCRCDECRDAASVYHRERRKALRAWRTAA